MSRGIQTEQKIIEAATAIFLMKGKDGARTQEIADVAGVNKALLHYYFRSKDQLYETVFLKELEKFFVEFLDAIPRQQNFREFLQFFIGNYVDRLSGRTELIRFIVWEMSRGSKRVGVLFKALFARRGFTRNPIFDIVRSAVQSGEIREVDPIHFFLNIMGMCVYPFVAQPIIEEIFQGVSVTGPRFLEKRKQEIYELIWRGVRKRAEAE